MGNAAAKPRGHLPRIPVPDNARVLAAMLALDGNPTSARFFSCPLACLIAEGRPHLVDRPVRAHRHLTAIRAANLLR